MKILGLLCIKELAKETSFELSQHVTTKARNRTCFLESETTIERIYLRAFPVRSPSSLSVTYQTNRRFRNGVLAGHEFTLPPLRQPEPKHHVLDREIPKLFLVTEENLLDHITMVLSESCLPSSTQKRLVTHISKLEAIKKRRYRGGLKIEVEIRVEVEFFVQIGRGCKGKKACPWRVVQDRHVATRVTGTDCPICLTKLSGEECRMKLRCSHVFHKDCVLKWLKKNTRCPICRAKAIGQIASIY